MNSELGLITLKSTAGYLGIRAQVRTYKYAATQNEKGKSQAHQKRDLGSLGFILFSLFSFLFFSFLFFSAIFIVLEQTVSVRLFSFVLFFLGSECYR